MSFGAMSRFAERFQKMSPGERAYALNMPIHFVRARACSRLERVLTDYEFIQAKADNGLISELIQDYALVERAWPDEEQERRRQCRLETTMQYVDQLVAYSYNPEQNPFPAVPPAEIRINQDDSTARGEPKSAAEHVACWGRFVGRYSEPIARRSAPLFQMAYNSAESGPVVADIESRLGGGLVVRAPWLKVLNRSPYARDAGLVRILWGVDNFTNSVVMDSSGRLAASGGDSGAISIWDLETGQVLGGLRGHSQSITALAATPNMAHIISGSEDGTIRIWETYEGRCLSVFDSDDGRVVSLAITPAGRLAVSCGEGAVCVWDLIRNECIACLVDHVIGAVAITADGKRMVLGGATNDDCSIYVYETHSLTQVVRLPGHEASVLCTAMTPDGRRAITGSYDQQVGMWDLEKLECLGLYREHDAWVRAVGITPDGRLAVSGGGDGSLRLWDLENEKTIALTGHTRPIDSLAVSVDGQRCASAAPEQGLYVWDLNSNDPSVIKKEEVSILTGTPNLNRRVQLAGKETLSVIWEDSEHTLCDRRRRMHALERFVATSDISLGVSTHADNIVRFWNLADGELIGSLDYSQKLRSLYLIPGTTWILVVLEDWRMELRNLQDGACLKDHRLDQGVYECVHSLTPDSRHLVLSDGNNSICFLDLETNSVSRVFHGHKKYVSGIEVSPDGKRMYSCVGSAGIGQLPVVSQTDGSLA
jgi:WD40 repeat protein